MNATEAEEADFILAANLRPYHKVKIATQQMKRPDQRANADQAMSQPTLGGKPMTSAAHIISELEMKRAMTLLTSTEELVHCAWMAARSMDGDELPAGKALQSVIHLVGEELEEMRDILRTAMLAKFADGALEAARKDWGSAS